MQTKEESSIYELKHAFWNPYVMKEWQEYLTSKNLNKDFYLDLNNILRLKSTKTGIAYVGGVSEKAEMGLKYTNPLREKTSSFQYIFGLTKPLLRQDNLRIGGTLAELIAESDIEDWLTKTLVNEESRLQIFSIIMQLYYAAYLLAETGWDVEDALRGIKIREVIHDATVPFFDGSISTHGVIPVIYELDKLKPIPEIMPQDVTIPYILDLIAATGHWSVYWKEFEDIYQGMDVKNGEVWNNAIGTNTFSQETATFTCRGKPCIGRASSRFAQSNSNTKAQNGIDIGALRYERDLTLLDTTQVSLPDHIQPFASAFSIYLAAIYPNDPTFNLREEVNPSLAVEYLNLGRVQNTYLSLNNELYFLIKDQGKPFRRFTPSDLEFGSPINEFFLRQDFIIPALELGDEYPLGNGIVVERYNEEEQTFTLRDRNEETFQLSYDDLFDYASRVLQTEPYAYRSIPRQNIAMIEGKATYFNRESGEMYPLPQERIYVRNINQTIELIYNAQSLLSLGLSLLYDETANGRASRLLR